MKQQLPLLSAAPTVPTSLALAVPAAEQPTPGASAAATASTSCGPGIVPSCAAPMALLLPGQARLAQLWAGSLGIDVNEIRASDNFFRLGGDAVRAREVMRQAERELGLRVEPQRYVSECLGQLAWAMDAGPAAAATRQAPGSQPGLLGRMLGGWGRKH